MNPRDGAFPNPHTGADGLTKRELGAFLILAGMMSNPGCLNQRGGENLFHKENIKAAVELSELLLKELNEPTQDRDRGTPKRK